MKSFIDLMALTLDDHPHAVLITSPPSSTKGTEILYANKKFSEMAGYSRYECIGQSPKMFQGKKTSKNSLKRFVETLARGKQANTTIINYRKNGEEYWCDIVAWPIHDKQGDLLCYFAFEREFEKTRGRPKKDRSLEKWWA